MKKAVFEQLTLSNIKGALINLRQFLGTERLLKLMKNAFYSTLKARLVLKIYKAF